MIKVIFYLECIAQSYNYFITIPDTIQNESKTMLIALLKEIYKQHNPSNTDMLIKNKSILSHSSSSQKQKIAKKMLVPIKLSLDKGKDFEKSYDKIQDEQKTESSDIHIKPLKECKKKIESNYYELSENTRKYIYSFESYLNQIEDFKENCPELDEDYKINRNCKNILLERFFKKNEVNSDCKKCTKANTDVEYSDKTDISDNEFYK